METSRGEQADDAMTECIAACNECNRICMQHVEHCLTLGGAHAEPGHISMLLSCASVCRTAGELMSLNSEWHPTMCDLCAQVCEECADQCDELGDMEDCVAACQDCAEACREMLGEPVEEDEEEPQEELVTSDRIN